MNKKDLRQHVSEFYGEKSLSAGTAARLKAMAATDRGQVAPTVIHHYPGRWLQVTIGLAASFAMILSAVSFYQVQAQSRMGPIVQDNLPGTTGPVPSMRLASSREVPRYVTLKFQIAGCPAAAGIEPVFNQLVEKYAEKPVMFARYDMTNNENRRLSRSLASGLGIDFACEGPYQSGTILLIDRKRCEVVCKLTSKEQLPEMERKLEKVLH